MSDPKLRPDPAAPAAPHPAARKLGDGLGAIGRALSERRGLRVAVLGVLLTLVALELGEDSALAIPLLVIGLVMLVVGVMGPRLRGHFGLDFGPAGTSISIQTHIAPPGHKPASEDAGATPAQRPGRPQIALVPPDAEVVESTGETIELDVAQLQALLAADRTARAGETAAS